MAKKKKGRGWHWRKQRKHKPQIDHSRPFHEQIQQAQEEIDRKRKREPLPNVVIDEVIISAPQLRKITHAWLHEPLNSPRKERLMWLMLLYSQPVLSDLAKRLGIDKIDLIKALRDLKEFD